MFAKQNHSFESMDLYLFFPIADFAIITNYIKHNSCLLSTNHLKVKINNLLLLFFRFQKFCRKKTNFLLLFPFFFLVITSNIIYVLIRTANFGRP